MDRGFCLDYIFQQFEITFSFESHLDLDKNFLITSDSLNFHKQEYTLQRESNLPNTLNS